MRGRVLLVCFDERRAENWADPLLANEFEVVIESKDAERAFVLSGGLELDAIIFDLGFATDRAGDTAKPISRRTSTRDIPLVFVDGTAEEEQAIIDLLGDAIFCDPDELATTIGLLA